MASKKRWAATLYNLKNLRAIQGTIFKPEFQASNQESHLGQRDPEMLFQPSRHMITHNQHYFHIYSTTTISYFSTWLSRSRGKQLKQALNTTILSQYILKGKVALSPRTSSKCSSVSSHQQAFKREIPWWRGTTHQLFALTAALVQRSLRFISLWKTWSLP